LGGTNAQVVTTVISSSRTLDWLGTARGRFGYLVTPSLLAYGTGGLAYGHVGASTAITQSNNDAVFFPATPIQTVAATAGTFSQMRYGWTVGAGAEWMFMANWSAKIEYFYYDLGSVTFPNGALVVSSGGFTAAAGPVVIASASSTRFNGNIIRVGLNYKFGNYYAPVVTK